MVSFQVYVLNLNDIIEPYYANVCLTVVLVFQVFMC